MHAFKAAIFTFWFVSFHLLFVGVCFDDYFFVSFLLFSFVFLFLAAAARALHAPAAAAPDAAALLLHHF